MMPLLQTNFYQTQTDWKTLAIFGGIITLFADHPNNINVFAKSGQIWPKFEFLTCKIPGNEIPEITSQLNQRWSTPEPVSESTSFLNHPSFAPTATTSALAESFDPVEKVVLDLSDK